MSQSNRIRFPSDLVKQSNITQLCKEESKTTFCHDIIISSIVHYFTKVPLLCPKSMVWSKYVFHADNPNELNHIVIIA